MEGFITALSQIGSALINFVGNIVSALFSESGAWGDLLPFFLIGIIISIVMVAVKIIRKVVWGA